MKTCNVLLGTSLLLAVAAAHADSSPAEAGRQLEGTWVVSVDPPGPVPPTHLAFTSFIKGGVVIGSPDVGLPPPIARIDTVHGVWEGTRGKEFVFTFVALAYDTSGRAINTVKINSRVRLTGEDSFVGNSQLLICDLNLTCPPPAPGLATISGTRLQVEPPVSP